MTEIKKLKLKDLEEFGGNPQKMSKSEFNGLVESFKRNGWLLDAPVVWEYEENKYKIIAQTSLKKSPPSFFISFQFFL